MNQTQTIDRKKVTLSNVEKVLFPSGFTKGQVIDYYQRIAPVLLPHLKGRPLTLKRYPNGTDKPFFYEKQCPSHRPDWVSTASVVGSTGEVNFCVANSRAILAWVANLASLELHTLLCKSTDLSKPTMMVFDLDPGAPANITDCIRVALRVRDVLAHFDLQSFVKTSGGKGIHMNVPLNTKVTFDETKSFAKAIAELLSREDPKRVTSTMSRQIRDGKIFVDWSQNDRHKTTVCAYSLRAKDSPSVSTPVTWDELAAAQKKPKRLEFGPEDVLDRVEKMGDLYAEVLTRKQRLPKMT